MAISRRVRHGGALGERISPEKKGLSFMICLAISIDGVVAITANDIRRLIEAVVYEMRRRGSFEAPPSIVLAAVLSGPLRYSALNVGRSVHFRFLDLG